jgi:hypothetical protein
MERLLYQAHEARRHTDAIRDILQRSCKAVFPEPNVGFRLKDGPWYLPGPAQQVSISVFQKIGCCGRKPVCAIEISRPKTGQGMHDYTKATAVFVAPDQQAGNTRLVGHLQRHCPFLPKFEVTLDYDAKG